MKFMKFEWILDHVILPLGEEPVLLWLEDKRDYKLYIKKSFELFIKKC